VPALASQWARFFDPKTLPQDLLAMASLFCIAVPLNLAIGVASGVPLQVALVSAGISAPIAAMMGGTTLAVTGCSPVMSVLVCQAINAHGLVAVPMITISVGALQLLSGLLNVGWLVKLTPIPVIAGFTTGVGVLIAVGQVPKVLGLPAAAADANAFEILRHTAMNAGMFDPLCLGVGAVTLAVANIVPRLHKKAGGVAALAAVGAGTATASALAASGVGTVKLVGAMPPMVLSELFCLPTACDLVSLAPTISLLYVLMSVESLLSATAVDKMRATSYKHDPSQELVGQGLANMATGCFSGMPVTSVIARSALNVQSGGQSRLPALGQGLLIIGGLNTMAPMLESVPMSALAAVLVNLGFRMMKPPEIVHCVRVQRTDIMPYGATVFGMLSMGLAEGCALGFVTSLVFSGANWNQPETAQLTYTPASSVRTSLELYDADKLWEMDKERLIRLIMGNYEKDVQSVMGSYVTPDDLEMDNVCPACGGEGILQVTMTSYGTPDNLEEGENEKLCPTCEGMGVTPVMNLPSVWWLNGPVNFLSVFRIAALMDEVRRDRPHHGRCIFDLHGCRALDLTGAEALLDGLEQLRKEDVKVTLMNAPESFQGALLACASAADVDVYRPGAFADVARPPPVRHHELDLSKIISSSVSSTTDPL